MQEINNSLEKTVPYSPRNEEVSQEKEGEEENKEKGEVTPPKDPLTEAETSKKRKVSPNKTSAWKNSRTNKPQLHIVLMVDDIDLIIVAVSDTSKDIL
jgi:hypothetical protein